MSTTILNGVATPASARQVIQQHSRSFSLASLLLAPLERQRAEALYAYCRRADDLIDLAPAREADQRLYQLRRELDSIYAGDAQSQPTLAEFQRVVFDTRIPAEYPEALLHGFDLDACGAIYETTYDLQRYCWCVAGSVGGMMCHALGVRSDQAVVHGVHLGMAMQLTNICRDVAEDWQRGRLYLPLELAPGLHRARAEQAFPRRYLDEAAGAVRALLHEADAFYRSGDRGLAHLAPRARFSIAVARNVYSAIGGRILHQGADVLAGRAIVSKPRKLWQLARAAGTSLVVGLTRPATAARLPTQTVRFPEDVLPV